MARAAYPRMLGTITIVASTPRLLATTLESTKTGRVTGLESTHAAVPSLFSPTRASCMMIMTPTAGNRPTKTAKRVSNSSAGGESGASATAVINPPTMPPQIRDWTHQVRVLNQRAKPLRSMLLQPRPQPRSLTISNASFPDILTSFDHLQEDIFQVILL